jgi:hypothetical protein
MRVTLNLSDAMLRRLREEAVRQGRTVAEVVEGALRESLWGPDAPAEFPPLPAFRMGRARVDVANRDEVHGVLDAQRRRNRR